MTTLIKGDAPRSPAAPPPFAGLGHDFTAVRRRAESLRVVGVVFDAVRVIHESFSEPFGRAVSGFELLLLQGRETRGR